MTSHRLTWLISLLVVGLALAGCRSSRDGDAIVASIGDLGHVHDIVVQDGDVLLAAHSGLFRIEGPTRAVLVGDFRHDLMSMEASPSGLVASGHPDLRFEEWRVAGQPAHLGLISSDDGGDSWTRVSLLGEVDFHSLAARPDGGFYGADSAGRILASDDGVEWEERSLLSAVDLAASPHNPEALLGIEASGSVVLSTDGARSWTEVAGTPALARVQWRGSDIVGMTGDGQIYSADSPGEEWKQRYRVDEHLVAFTSRGDSWWIVTDDASVLHADDDGAAFVEVYKPPERPRQ